MNFVTLFSLIVSKLFIKSPASPEPNIVKSLPGSADEIELRFQPVLDFEWDSCYNTAAISVNGDINPGKRAASTPQRYCRDPLHLFFSNAYSRRRCNNGICAIMYEYYFEKDQALSGSFLGGHRHDWENIIVFAEGDKMIRVAPACHGRYKHAANMNMTKVLTQGGHPIAIYHKDGIHTHCFRLADKIDLGHINNHLGMFHRSPLVGWNNWPNETLRDKMLQAWSKSVGPNLDDEFANTLRKAAGDHVPGFDPDVDE